MGHTVCLFRFLLPCPKFSRHTVVLLPVACLHSQTTTSIDACVIVVATEQLHDLETRPILECPSGLLQIISFETANI